MRRREKKGAEKGKKGCGEEKKGGAEKRKCTLGPPYLMSIFLIAPEHKNAFIQFLNNSM